MPRRPHVLALGALLLAACGGGGAPGGAAGSPSPFLDGRLPGTPVPRPSGMTDEAFDRAVFDEVMRAEARAVTESERLFPMLDTGAPGFREEKFRKQMNKQRATREGLMLKFRGQIADRNKMTVDELEKLVERGRALGWAPASPSPPAQ